MIHYTVEIERDENTGLLTGHIKEYPDVRAHGATVDEIRRTLAEKLSTLVEDDEMFWPPTYLGDDGIL